MIFRPPLPNDFKHATFNSLSRKKSLKANENLALKFDSKMGVDSDEMIRTHKPMILFMVKRFKSTGIESKDLIQVSCVGLFKAYLTFDEKRGMKFTTFAFYFMRKELQQAVANMRLGLRIPIGAKNQILHLKFKEKKLTDFLGRSPTDEELANSMGIRPKVLKIFI